MACATGGEDGEGGIGENKASAYTCRFRTSDRLKHQAFIKVVLQVAHGRKFYECDNNIFILVEGIDEVRLKLSLSWATYEFRATYNP